MWARIENDRVSEITDVDPSGRFHSSLTWVKCSSEVAPGWRYHGEQFSPPDEQSIQLLAAEKRRHLDRARDEAFAMGTEFTFQGDRKDYIQIRPEDKANLLAIAMEARDLKAGGESNPVIDFRAASNTTYKLTPIQAIEMTNAALAQVKSIYEKSWQLKDSIEAAIATNDRETIRHLKW